MITRFFHPVGQGAFYSERHKGFNIVYDCGELHNKKSAKEVVKQAFNSETIDILFISHLDYDHISLIDTLKANNTIKKVVLPLTQEDGKILSIASCIRGEKTISDNLINLILNPYAYFGKDTEILGVRPYKTEYYDNSNLRPLDSGIPIEKPQKGSLLDDDWCFIPYNIQSFSRTQLFKKKIAEEGLDYDLITDLAYLKSNLKNIKNCYDALPGGTNGNSMIVYSGPRKENRQLVNHHHQYCYRYQCNYIWHRLDEKAACIYTGDVNLKDIDLNSLFGQYNQFIGTVQIPHHGSLHSFDENNFFANPVLAPVSFGCNNIFGHPSAKVLDFMLRRGHHTISITNNIDSLYIQEIL